MDYLTLLTMCSIIALVSTLAHQWSFLHYKKIANISLIQYIYLVIIPGILFAFAFSFIFDLIQRPLNANLFLADRPVIVFLILSIMYTYGGVAIHTVAKVLASCFQPKHQNTFAFQVNKYFHLSFSHNLTFAGVCSSAVFLSLLEFNHQPPLGQNPSFLLPVLNGIIIGLTFVVGIIIYRVDRKPWSEHKEVIPWSDLKFFFYVFWSVFVVFVLAGKPHFGAINQYPISLSISTAGLVIALLSIFLYSRRLYRKISVRLNNHQ